MKQTYMRAVPACAHVVLITLLLQFVGCASTVDFASIPLLVEADRGQLDRVRTLLDAGTDVNTADMNGARALMFAALNGHTETVRLLLDRGADVNARDRNRGTALMFAADDGRAEIVRLLLDRGADVNARYITGQTALMFAAKGARPMQTVRVIIAVEQKRKITEPPPGSYVDTIRALLDNGADANARDRRGNTVLMHAVGAGAFVRNAPEIVRILLDGGADVNARDATGRTALIHAAALPDAVSEGPWRVPTLRLEIVRTLLDRGADVNARDAAGRTALMAATGPCESDVIGLLKSAGAAGRC